MNCIHKLHETWNVDINARESYINNMHRLSKRLTWIKAESDERSISLFVIEVVDVFPRTELSC